MCGILNEYDWFLFFADSSLKLLQGGKFNKSNIMIGVTKDDGSVFAVNVLGKCE